MDFVAIDFETATSKPEMPMAYPIALRGIINWYRPIPSEPIILDKYILKKNPRHLVMIPARVRMNAPFIKVFTDIDKIFLFLNILFKRGILY